MLHFIALIIKYNLDRVKSITEDNNFLAFDSLNSNLVLFTK